MFSKIIKALILLILGLSIATILGMYGYRDNADLHNFLLSQVLDEDIRTEGVLKIEIKSGVLQANFDGWAAHNAEEPGNPVVLSVGSGSLSYNLSSLIGFGTSIPSIDMKGVVYNDRDTFKPIKISSVTKAEEDIDISGKIGGVPITARVKADKNSLTLSIQELKMQAKYGLGGLSDLEDITLTKGDRAINGAYKKRGKKHLIALKFADKNHLNIQYKGREGKKKASLSSNKFNLQDISNIRFFVNETMSLTDQIMVEENDDEPNEKASLNVTINIQKLDALGKDAGHIKAKLLRDIKGVRFDPQDVVIADGRVKGNAFISSQPAQKTNIDLEWNDYNFGLFRSMLGQESKSLGKGNFRADLTAQGGDISTLKQTLNGAVDIELKDGRIGAGFINLWGGGVINSLMPSFKEKDQTDLNCARVYVKLENGEGRVKPVVMDTSKVTLYGKGELNIPNNTINLVIKPKSKGIALGNISSAVRVSGKLSDPSFSLDTMSALKKIGGIALGTVNPAFFIFSLSDLGLNQEDVCAK